MEQTHVYRPKGVCSKEMQITYDGDTIVSVKIIGGCAGNTQGVAALLAGMKIQDGIARLKGIKCRPTTSCPDQVACALEEILQKSN